MIAKATSQDPAIVHIGVFDFHVCVPGDWSDEQIEDFAESACECGKFGEWKVQGDRLDCPNREGFVHMSLTACPKVESCD